MFYLKNLVKKIQKIHHIFKYPYDSLKKETKHLTLKNDSTINKIITWITCYFFQIYTSVHLHTIWFTKYIYTCLLYNSPIIVSLLSQLEL